MPRSFLDTSALLKLYDSESGTPVVEEIVDHPDSRTYVSWLGVIEFRSALAVKVRTGNLDVETLAQTVDLFRADIDDRLIRVYRGQIDSQSRTAVELVGRFAVSEGLRTLDSLQLAAGIELLESG